MNATTISTTLLTLFALHGAAQAQNLQLYGRLNLGLERMHLHGGAGDASGASPNRTRLSNYRSVFGVRASEAIAPGLHVLLQVEGTLSPDSGAGAFAARDTRVGLEGRWGTLFAGNWTTPYTSSSAALDPFYPTTAGYMSIMGNGSAATADNVSDTTSFDRRQQNSVHYWSPTWNGVSLRLAHGLNEERPASGARPSLTSSAMLFERGPWYAALAWERHRHYRGPGLNDDAIKLAGSHQLWSLKLAAAVERLRYRSRGAPLERTAYYVSAQRQFGAHGVRLGVAKAGDGKGGDGAPVGFITPGRASGGVHATVGYDYAFSKRTSVFAWYTRLHNARRATIDFAINGVDGGAGATASGAVLGMRHAF